MVYIMAKLSKKTTIYLNPYVKTYLQHRAVQENRSVSEIINDEMADLLEDMQDAAELKKRLQNPQFLPWEQVKKQLKADGLL